MTKELTEGTKFDGGKARPDLLDWDVMRLIDGHAPTTYRDAEFHRQNLWAAMNSLSLWFHRGTLTDMATMFGWSLDLLAATLPLPSILNYDGPSRRSTAALEVAKVLAFGAEKYAPRNWEKGIKYSRLYASALRHAHAYLSGEYRDPETGLSHLAHFACCLMFLASYTHRGFDAGPFDDREGTPTTTGASDGTDPTPATSA
jgi:hypothetical protein